MTDHWITCYLPSAVLLSHILVFGKNVNHLRSLDVIPDEFTDLINNQVTSNHPAVEDLNSVVIRISDDQIVVLCNTDLTGIVEFALLLSFSANCFHKLTLRENVHLIDVQIEDFEVGSNITSQFEDRTLNSQVFRKFAMEETLKNFFGWR